jgi:Zn finger protein HypA/HybF involved in hydrogenase expression
MGVHTGEADGDVPLLLACQHCGLEYETDETMGNDCPDCGAVDYEIVSTVPSEWRGVE